MAAAGDEQGGWSMGTTELYSCANMVVIGGQGTTIQHTGKFSDVKAFAADVGMMTRVPIVDAVIAYDFPHSGEVFLLVTRNSLYIKIMDHNLVPPFIMREEGLDVNYQAKIHSSKPTKRIIQFGMHKINYPYLYNYVGRFWYLGHDS